MSATMTGPELIGRFRAQRDRFAPEAFEAVALAMKAAADPNHPIDAEVPWDHLSQRELIALGMFILDWDLRFSLELETRELVESTRSEIEALRAELKQARADVERLNHENSELRNSKKRLREALERLKEKA